MITIWDNPLADQILKEEWKKGTSTSAIARALTAAGLPATKNSVISRANRCGERLGITKRREAPVVAQQRRKSAFSDLQSKNTCRWPIGNPGEAGFRFCSSETVVAGKPYCTEHCLKAYRSKDEPADETPALPQRLGTISLARAVTR